MPCALAPSFVGFVSDVDILSVQIGSLAANQWVAVDQFQIDAAFAVPEHELAGLGLSLFGLGLIATRRPRRR